MFLQLILFLSLWIHVYVSGFEHFDVLHLVDGDFGIARGKKVEIVNAILQSPLQRALHAGNVA